MDLKLKLGASDVLTGELKFILSLVHLFADHAVFSNKTFGLDGQVGPLGSVKHVALEVVEILAAPKDPVEFADLMFLTFDSVRRFLAQEGITPEEFIEIAKVKLQDLESRTWPEPKDGEPRQHVKGNIKKEGR